MFWFLRVFFFRELVTPTLSAGASARVKVTTLDLVATAGAIAFMAVLSERGEVSESDGVDIFLVVDKVLFEF